jgi:hypothetical protein
VAADVVKDVDVAVVVAQDDQGVRAIVHRDVVTRFRQFGDASGKDPVRTEDGFHVDLEDRGIGVEGGVQGVAGAPELEQGTDLGQLLGRQC